MKTITLNNYSVINFNWLLIVTILFVVTKTDAYNNNESGNTMSTVERHRVWINVVDNSNGAFSQTLFGYRTGATDGVDYGLDGAYFNNGIIALTSLIGNDRYAIQFRGLNYSSNDVIPLSFMSTYEGNFTFVFDHADGFFANSSQPVYILDTETNTYTNIKTENYTFSCSVGMYNNRFKLVFYHPGQVSNLGITDNSFSKNDISVYSNHGDILIESNRDQLQSLAIFNLNGQMIYQNNKVNAVRLNLSGLNSNHQVLLVKATTIDGNSITKKWLSH